MVPHRFVVPVEIWASLRLLDQRLGGEMQDPIEVVTHQHIGGVLDPALNPLGALGNGVGVTCRQVVQDDHLVACP